MTNQLSEQDRSLHFIVRHENYKQTPGYGLYLNDVLQDINAHPPHNARELLLDTAYLMSKTVEWDGQTRIEHSTKASEPDKKSPQYHARTKALSSLIQSHHLPTGNEGKVPVRRLFGPAARIDFGLLRHENGSWLLTTKIIVGAIKDRQLDTPVGVRLYADTLKRNLPQLDKQQDVIHQFSYPLANGESLKLMSIVKGVEIAKCIADLGRIHKQPLTEVTKLIQRYNDVPVIFIHPNFNDSERDSLIDAIQEQWDILRLDDRIEPKNGMIPNDKKEALATIYWLAAQSTVVARGGSAHANLMLEHLGCRLQEQGYKYEIPYTKDGIDLWAEAATTPLDMFKERFVNDAYYDKNITDNDVKQWLVENTQAVDESIGPTEEMGPDFINPSSDRVVPLTPE